MRETKGGERRGRGGEGFGPGVLLQPAAPSVRGRVKSGLEPGGLSSSPLGRGGSGGGAHWEVCAAPDLGPVPG